MNEIALRQNVAGKLDLIRAYRQLYSESKSFANWPLMLGLGVALVSAIISIWAKVPQIVTLAFAAVGIGVRHLAVRVKITNKVQTASQLQEQFDCDVLELEWNESLEGRTSRPELVQRYATKYKDQNEFNFPPIKNWYEGKFDDLPIGPARLLCQRQNFSWDDSLRNQYLKRLGILIGFFIVALLSSIGAALVLEANFLCLLAIAAPVADAVLPILIELIGSTRRLRSLDEKWQDAWNDAFSPGGLDRSTDKARKIQNEIFKHRMKSAPVPDKIYKKFFPPAALANRYAANSLADEARLRLKKLG